ncbi:DEAD/DEAH box helicase [Paenibacillus sp. LHD-117]|uniref:DEAD/DEAH box helicase n=1 Tax=Paenibacillus sp. LHD-117 TaxID=3071412 RepID=UPI0027DF3798|nr:DEAD/DEAH box helicase [Paenibacillus sp. LHD-117]MDQ6419654.1 DEAD/DEAH box helicase [Paenibacillus sp. LHD-117]
MNFNDLQLMPDILKALKEENLVQPTPIQEQAIPVALHGRDVLGCAQTGTGKTAAFSLPIIQQLCQGQNPPQKRRPIRSLILTPTRELAIQIDDNIRAYSRFTPLRTLAIVGGVSQKGQEKYLDQGIDILIATPGRLMDLMNQGLVDLKQVQVLVLDEADRMLDMGFINDVKKIVAKLPTKKQTMLFSATMPPEIAKLADTLLVNPAKIEVTPASSTVDRIEQSVYFVDKANKIALLADLLSDKSIASALVFTRTKHGADRVARALNKGRITAQAIHGDKSQNSRQNALNNFKNGATRVLVATDIAARGIDIEELSHVYNFNLPNIPETYVHRIGRTGRAGHSGVAVSFCEEEELPYLKDIEKLIKKKIPVVDGHAYPMQGEAAIAAAAFAAGGSGKGSKLQGKAQQKQAPKPQQGKGQQPKQGAAGQQASKAQQQAKPRQGAKGQQPAKAQQAANGPQAPKPQQAAKSQQPAKPRQSSQGRSSGRQEPVNDRNSLASSSFKPYFLPARPVQSKSPKK